LGSPKAVVKPKILPGGSLPWSSFLAKTFSVYLFTGRPQKGFPLFPENDQQEDIHSACASPSLRTRSPTSPAPGMESGQSEFWKSKIGEVFFFPRQYTVYTCKSYNDDEGE
jgi:hypothetical protein